MGGSRFDDKDWSSYASANSTRTVNQAFKSTTINKTNDARTSFDPTTIKLRESRDSDANPESTAIILAFDETGSMGRIPYHFVQSGLGTLMKEIYDRKPVTDPHIMVMAVGDAKCDSAPLQVTQFEADMKIAEQVEKLFLEGRGGGNGGESYHLAHYFAATKTATDCFEKRGKKGLLFTIGDEPPHETLTVQQISRFIGGEPLRDLNSREVIEMAGKTYDIFHIVVMQGEGIGQYGEQAVIGAWNTLLPEGHVIRLNDYTKLSEVIVSAIQINAGVDRDQVVKSWSGDTSLVVAGALSKSLTKKQATSQGVVRL